jgi:hypothetical protein
MVSLTIAEIAEITGTAEIGKKGSSLLDYGDLGDSARLRRSG